MPGMNTIGVRVRDHSGDNEARMRLRTGRTIGQVRPRILDRLALSEREGSGEPITYAFYNETAREKPYLQDNQVVGDVLVDGETLRVVPEITAGNRPGRRP
jgi:hypothetical protein